MLPVAFFSNRTRIVGLHDVALTSSYWMGVDAEVVAYSVHPHVMCRECYVISFSRYALPELFSATLHHRKEMIQMELSAPWFWFTHLQSHYSGYNVRGQSDCDLIRSFSPILFFVPYETVLGCLTVKRSSMKLLLWDLRPQMNILTQFAPRL